MASSRGKAKNIPNEMHHKPLDAGWRRELIDGGDGIITGVCYLSPENEKTKKSHKFKSKPTFTTYRKCFVI
jgi:hypothetical protein